jgi:stage II sporulation protein D
MKSMNFIFRALIVPGLVFLSGFSLCMANVRVSIFNGHSLSALVITPQQGEYSVTAGEMELFTLKENELLYISRKGEGLFLSTPSGSPGIYTNVSLIATGIENVFSIRPLYPSMKEVMYYGELNLSVSYGRISLINIAEKNHYLAGVVEAESGTGSVPVFYKTQAVICRTYLYGNLHRHADEGFDLCDEVHCQVYKGRLTDNKTICEAVRATTGLVIKGNDGKLITAAFHANCGGQTASSEEVWLVPLSYLRRVNDPWCQGRPGSAWQVVTDADKWISYLVSMGYNGMERENPVIFNSFQKQRAIFYRIGDFSIPYRKIRADWNLRSAYFDIEAGHGREIRIRGRGYGHGAGLCQEGAMQMAIKGYDFIEILQFYYAGISITDVDKLFR